jgi:hypothetical protein
MIIPGLFGAYSGDVTQDGSIDVFDALMCQDDIANFASGYFHTDLNGDGSVDLFDGIVIDNNVSQYIGIISP